MAAEFDLVASALRADAADVDVFFDVLAAKLEQVLPGQVEIRRGGLLGRGAPEALTVTLGERVYEAERERRQVACRRRTVVRGIALKSEDLDLGAWIDELSAGLVEEAARSAHARAALDGLLNA
ncbi:MAG TPA: hypothetical protein VFG42_08600 [Baekduia sp.]|uniref:hypothetical protein n=1 Tax=Baekduia sp. TaxID=2600305 RepID=UPI002D766FC7|nr:hypothetical protein [Baekduia sp.]HET6506836.1 hypothetical protein [Baekduia sp.]